MTSLRTLWLVAEREVRERATSRSFQVSTGVTLLLVIAALVIPAIVASDEAPTFTVGVVGEPSADLEGTLEATAPEPGTGIEIEIYDDRTTLEEAVLDDDPDIGIVDGPTVLQAPDTDPELLTLVASTLQAEAIADRAAELDLSPDQVTDLIAGGVEVEQLSADDEEGRTMVAFFGTVLLLVSIVTYGQWILIGVVEEKTSRVVEVILGAVRPRELLAGKVAGIGLLGLAQLVVIALIGIVGVRLNSEIDLPDVGIGLALIVVVWFLIGFTFYAAGYAVAGALVSRQEDAQNAAFPLTMVMFAAYFIASSAIAGEDNPVLRVASLVPPFSPITMPIRQATGAAGILEIAFAAALMIGATWLMLRVGGRVYAGGLLRSGGRIKVREAFRSAGG